MRPQDTHADAFPYNECPRVVLLCSSLSLSPRASLCLNALVNKTWSGQVSGFVYIFRGWLASCDDDDAAGTAPESFAASGGVVRSQFVPSDSSLVQLAGGTWVETCVRTVGRLEFGRVSVVLLAGGASWVDTCVRTVRSLDACGCVTRVVVLLAGSAWVAACILSLVVWSLVPACRRRGGPELSSSAACRWLFGRPRHRLL
jgi:hypothetical protein